MEGKTPSKKKEKVMNCMRILFFFFSTITANQRSAFELSYTNSLTHPLFLLTLFLFPPSTLPLSSVPFSPYFSLFLTLLFLKVFFYIFTSVSFNSSLWYSISSDSPSHRLSQSYFFFFLSLSFSLTLYFSLSLSLSLFLLHSLSLFFDYSQAIRTLIC